MYERILAFTFYMSKKKSLGRSFRLCFTSRKPRVAEDRNFVPSLLRSFVDLGHDRGQCCADVADHLATVTFDG